MEPFRLDSVAPLLASRFRRAPPDKRRSAARIACEKAVLTTGLTASDVRDAMTFLSGATSLDESLRQRLETLAASFDEQHFRLSEDVNQQQQALECFSRARASSALAFCVAADDGELHEAIYESIAAVDDPAELMRLVERALT